MKQLLAVNIADIEMKQGTLGSNYPSLSTLVNIVLKNSLTIAGIILVFLLIYGGLMFIISAGSGDQKKSQQSQAIITNALIGFVVVICAYFIIQIIEVLTGLTIL